MRIKDLRYILGKAALNTPGVYYYSSDLAEEAPEQIRKKVSDTCGLIAMSALETIEPGGQANISFGTLYQSDEEKGSWDALVMRGEEFPVEEYPLPEFTQTASAEDLRPWISENINQTPKTILMDKNLFQDFPEKDTLDGETMSPMTQGVMSTCIALEPFLKVGETLRLVFTLVLVGAEDGGVFLIELTRKE